MQPGTSKVSEKGAARAPKHNGDQGERGSYANTPSRLSPEARAHVCESLNLRLADGLDLHSQIKVAHWNIKGPHFAALHPLFEKFAEKLADYNDEIAERAVTLGGYAYGTVREAAKRSKLAEYPAETRRDLEHVRLVAERIEAYLAGLRETRDIAEQNGDIDTHDMIVQMTTKFEKYGWFLRATLEESGR